VGRGELTWRCGGGGKVLWWEWGGDEGGAERVIRPGLGRAGWGGGVGGGEGVGKPRGREGERGGGHQKISGLWGANKIGLGLRKRVKIPCLRGVGVSRQLTWFFGGRSRGRATSEGCAPRLR